MAISKTLEQVREGQLQVIALLLLIVVAVVAVVGFVVFVEKAKEELRSLR